MSVVVSVERGISHFIQMHVCLCMCSFHITGEGAEVQCVCCSHSSCESQRALVLFLHYLTVLQKRMPPEADQGTLSLWWTCSIIENTLKTLMQSSSQWGLSLCHSVFPGDISWYFLSFPPSLSVNQLCVKVALITIILDTVYVCTIYVCVCVGVSNPLKAQTAQHKHTKHF